MVNSKLSKNAEGVGQLVKPRWRIYALIAVVGLIITGILSYGFHTGDRMIKIYAPLVDATMEIKLEATIAHLWFEEIVTGDRHEELETVWKHLDQADWYAKAMLEGGRNPEGIFIPLDNNKMRREIRDVQEKLMAFRDITKKRIAAQETSGIGTPIDQHYDKVFRDLFNQADQVETSLQKIMTEDLSRFRYIQVILIAISLLLFLSIIMAFHHFDHRRIKDFVSIRETNKNLELEIDERKQAEQALKNNQIFLKRIINQSPFATWISDEKGTMIKCNAALKKFSNITDEQLIGKYNVFEDEAAIEQGLIPKIRTVFEDGKTANFSVEWDANELGYKDAKKVHIEGTMFPIHDDKGDLTNVLNFRDSTFRAKMLK